MGKQYSFKTTRRTGYLEDLLDEIPKKDRSEAIRQAVILGFLQMGKLKPDMVPMTGVAKVEPMPHKSPTIVTQTLDESPTKVTQLSDKIEPISEPPMMVEVEGVDEDLDAKLSNLYD